MQSFQFAFFVFYLQFTTDLKTFPMSMMICHQQMDYNLMNMSRGAILAYRRQTLIFNIAQN